MITTYKEAREYLEQFIPFIVNHRIEPDSKKAHNQLARMKYLLKLLDNPQQNYPSAVVSGTSGKGSVCYLISNMLTNANYKTGLTLSPHLQRITERIQIGDNRRAEASAKNADCSQEDNQAILPITNEEFILLLNEMVPIIEKMRKTTYGTPSYYEIILGMALVTFRNKEVDIAVVEVGLEGRYDATNLIDPLIFVLTNISLDHTNILGDTVDKIAKEATFRIKDLKPFRNRNPLVVAGVTQKSVITLLEKRCIRYSAALTRLHKDFDYKVKNETRNGVRFDFFRKGSSTLKQKNVFVSLLGGYQAENASIALEVVEKLKSFGFKIAASDIRNGLSSAVFPGRFEIVQFSQNPILPGLGKKKYTIVLDGGHNPVKIASFLHALEKIYPKRKKIFVIGFKKNKNVKRMLKDIIKNADMLIVTKFTVSMDWGKNIGMDVKTIEKQLKRIKGTNIEITYEQNVRNALAKALTKCYSKNVGQKNSSLRSGDEPLIVVTGSLYLLGEVRELLCKARLLS